MSNVMKKSFSEGEIKTPEKAHSSTVTLNNVTLSKAVLQPGWKWSTCIKPIVGTETCQAGHVGVIAQGTMHVKHDDGTEMEFTEGDTYFLAPGQVLLFYSLHLRYLCLQPLIFYPTVALTHISSF